MKANFENLGAREIKRLASTIILLNETRDITSYEFFYDLHQDEIQILEHEEQLCTFNASDFDIAFDNNDNALYI